MKLRPTLLTGIAALSLLFFLFSPVSSMDDPGFIIHRMVVCQRVVDREPVGVADTFPADTATVFCFLEARQIESDTTVSFVWYYNDNEMSRVALPLAKGSRWRTFASKKIAGLKGDWRIELQESSGIVLNTVSFRVQ